MSKKNLLVMLPWWTYLAAVVLEMILVAIAHGTISAPGAVRNGLLIWAMFFMAPTALGWFLCIPWRRVTSVFAKAAV